MADELGRGIGVLKNEFNNVTRLLPTHLRKGLFLNRNERPCPNESYVQDRKATHSFAP